MSIEPNIDNDDDIYIIIAEYDDPGDRDVKLGRTLSRAEDIVHDLKLHDPMRIRVYRVFPDPWDEESGRYDPFEDHTQSVSEEIDPLRFDKAEAVS
jgi:hypothetical protein